MTAYLFKSLEILETIIVDVLWLIPENFSSEVVEDVWEVVWDGILLEIFASHFELYKF